MNAKLDKFLTAEAMSMILKRKPPDPNGSWVLRFLSQDNRSLLHHFTYLGLSVLLS